MIAYVVAESNMDFVVNRSLGQNSDMTQLGSLFRISQGQNQSLSYAELSGSSKREPISKLIQVVG